MPSLPLMTVAEVAKQLACSTDQIHALINAGRLTAINIGSSNRPCYRISPESLDLFLNAMRTAPATKPMKRRAKPKTLANVTKYF